MVSALNPTLLKCPRCSSQMKLHVPGWGRVIVFIVTCLVLQIAIPRGLPPGADLAACFPLAFACDLACMRLYHVWWRRRHPQRCDGSTGHATPHRGQPAPGRAA
jgi:hypothetical protein